MSIDQGASPLPAVGAAQAINWDGEWIFYSCERCQRIYLSRPRNTSIHCPYCLHPELEPQIDTGSDSALEYTPELVVPFSLSTSGMEIAIQSFARGIPFPPQDLNPPQLRSRLQPLYLPMWLVDADVKAAWQAEAGFNYEVVSHQDKFEENRGGWSTRQIKETKIRWEPRLGHLKRKYQNILAPALEEHAQMIARLDRFDMTQARAFQPQAIQDALIRQPDRSPQDAWSDARPAFQSAAASECQQASCADHLRLFKWQPEFLNENWTLMLLPIYSTFYYDDDQKPQSVLIHGQSGKISGVRRASWKRAQKTVVTLLVIAAVIFMLGLALAVASVAFPPILAFGVVGLVIAILIGIGALIPLIIVWGFNRRNYSDR